MKIVIKIYPTTYTMELKPDNFFTRWLFTKVFKLTIERTDQPDIMTKEQIEVYHDKKALRHAKRISRNG